MTAKAIATALGRNSITLNLSNIVSSRIGETSKNLKSLFDKAAREKAVLFLDEFDHLAKSRDNNDAEVGEMRRLVNSLIQLLDYFPADALLIAATNHADVLDTALIMRFQVRIEYTMPNDKQLDAYYGQLLERFPVHIQDIERKYGISYAEAHDYAYTTVKNRLITEWENGMQPGETVK